MKTRILICLSFLLLTACEDKKNYEQAVLEQMKVEQDLIDYHIEPEHMAKCVVDLSTEKMPGKFAYDPDRMVAYRNYAKMITMNDVEDKQKMLEELRAVFGSPRELANAHSNYTESVMNCLASIIMETEKSEEVAENPAEQPAELKNSENPEKPVLEEPVKESGQQEKS